MAYFRGLVDLHVHLDGSLSTDTVRYLADMQNIRLIDKTDNKDITSCELEKKLKVSKDCRDLGEYLEKFDFTLPLLQSDWAVKESIYRLLKEQSQQGIIYSEIRFAPQLHTRKGLTMREVVIAALEGANRANRELPIGAALILCCMRGTDNVIQNEETVRLAAEFKDSGVAAIDLAGDESTFKTKSYENIFRQAKELGVSMTVHAGEADGPESIRAALKFGAKRIGHGIRAVEDTELVKLLAERKIPLELCPTSNLNTKVVNDIKDYPVMQLLDAGVKVTINTDNMTVSDTTVADELKLIKNTFGLSGSDIDRLIKNAREAAFLPNLIKG